MIEGQRDILTNEEQGIRGENLVREMIKKASCMVGEEVRVFNDVIIDYTSIYGRTTAELDHIIITQNRIIIGETKSAHYKQMNYDEMTWKLLNEKSADNPIIQNHYHKDVFCSVFGIERENVITVEVLLNYSSCEMKTKFVNDYVFGIDNILEGLCLLFSDDKNKYDFGNLCIALEKIEKESIYRHEEHKRNLAEIRRIEEKTRTRDGKYRFRRTDTAKCPLCDGELIFRHKNWLKSGNERKTENIAIGCSNFSSKKCSCFLTPKKDGGIGFDGICEIHIEERMGWTMEEKHIRTVLDEYIDLKNENERLNDELSDEKNKNVNKDTSIRELKTMLEDANIKVRNANTRAEEAEKTVQDLKRLLVISIEEYNNIENHSTDI